MPVTMLGAQPHSGAVDPENRFAVLRAVAEQAEPVSGRAIAGELIAGELKVSLSRWLIGRK